MIEKCEARDPHLRAAMDQGKEIKTTIIRRFRSLSRNE